MTIHGLSAFFSWVIESIGMYTHNRKGEKKASTLLWMTSVYAENYNAGDWLGANLTNKYGRL